MKLYILFLILVCKNASFCQVNNFDFTEVCDFISINTQGHAFLGTPSGLFQYLGTGQPEKTDLSQLDNNNIQSLIYTDKDGYLWFSTYNRIVKLKPSNLEYASYQLVSGEKDTLHSDYHVFGIDTIRNLLWAKQKTNLFMFGLNDLRSVQLCDSIEGLRILKVKSLDPVEFLLSYYYTTTPQIITISRTDNKCLSVETWKNWPGKCRANDMLMIDSLHVLIGTSKGLYIGNLESKTVYEIPLSIHESVTAIGKYSASSWIISFKKSGLKLLQRESLNFELKNFPHSGIEHPVERIISTSNGDIFLSSYHNRIYHFHPAKIKFKNVSTGRHYVFNKNNEAIQNLNKYIEEIDISLGGTPFAFTKEFNLSSPPPYNKSILSTPLGNQHLKHPIDTILYKYFTVNDDVYGSFLGHVIFKLSGTQWDKVRFPDNVIKDCNYYYPINDTLSIASLNQERIILWNTNTGDLKKEIVFVGDVYNEQCLNNGDKIVLSTDQGILQYDLKKEEFKILFRTPFPCLCLLKDYDNKIWFSSTEGLHTFDPVGKLLSQYHTSDGASYEKYARRKCIALSPDSLLFYHEKGITLVVPSSIQPYKGEASIYISNLKLNDIDYPVRDTLSYCSSFTVPYVNNTISFDATSIDWADPEHTNIRYQLTGYDDTWVDAESNEAFIRYANLPPGTYRLLIQGANADGIWNKSQKEIDIIVKPPFWMTWWFISFVVLASIGIIYTVFKSYYQRKLEKKNIVLREQAQVIKHQQELEHERTRIAAEMHDDLGSGLTTIRYLSDKALIHAKDATETEQIQRIAEHSNRLVRNMSEIIWAMNSRFDNAENLVGYLRRYASEFLSEHQMPLEFSSRDDSQQIIHVGGEKRRNIFLVFKEMLHNAVKYSGASKIEISVDSGDDIKITIREMGGKGFDAASASESGNGLYNAHKRMDTIGGKIAFSKSDDAMEITISAPVEKTAHA